MNPIGFLVFTISLLVMLAGTGLPLWAACAGAVAGVTAYVAAASR